MSRLDFDRTSDGKTSRPIGGYRIGGPAPPSGLGESDVLLRELESLDRRVAQLEAVYDRLGKATTWFTRRYRRLGRMLLRSPFAGAVERWMGSLAPQDQYRSWLALHRATDPYSSLGAGLKGSDDLGPLITVIVPVFQPNLSWLESAIDSIRAQSYPHWELLVVLDGMSWAVCQELLEDVRAEHWFEATLDEASIPPHPVIATLPSETRFSRASLLSGALVRGDSTLERKNFEASVALRQVCDKRYI